MSLLQPSITENKSQASPDSEKMVKYSISGWEGQQSHITKGRDKEVWIIQGIYSNKLLQSSPWPQWSTPSTLNRLPPKIPEASFSHSIQRKVHDLMICIRSQCGQGCWKYSSSWSRDNSVGRQFEQGSAGMAPLHPLWCQLNSLMFLWSSDGSAGGQMAPDTHSHVCQLNATVDCNAYFLFFVAFCPPLVWSGFLTRWQKHSKLDF